jgi:hypothetical protein
MESVSSLPKLLQANGGLTDSLKRVDAWQCCTLRLALPQDVLVLQRAVFLPAL